MELTQYTYRNLKPDITHEPTARKTLKTLRTWATQVEKVDRQAAEYLDAMPQAKPLIIADVIRLKRLERLIGPVILELECHFIEVSWRLPRWHRPDWLLTESRLRR